jgi:hypothetical protein
LAGLVAETELLTKKRPGSTRMSCNYTLLPANPKSPAELRALARRVRRLGNLTADAEIGPKLIRFAEGLEDRARALQAEVELP